MPFSHSLAAFIAALLTSLWLVAVAQAAPMQLQSFAPSALIDVSSSQTEPGGTFRPIDLNTEAAGGLKPMLIDGSRAEARVDFGEIGGGESGGGERPGLQARQFGMQVALSCRIAGGDLIIANKGVSAIAAGTTIKWQVRNSSQKGYLAMQSDVQPGNGFRARGVVDGSANGKGCTARGV